MREWIEDHAMGILIVLLMVFVVLAMIFHKPAKYVQAPAESCHGTFTGRSRVEDVPISSCAGYDKNGVCTLPITTYTQQTHHEVRMVCDFLYWN